MKCSDIPTADILNYLATRQGDWTMLWFGHFKGKDDSISDVYYAMPENTPHKLALAKMRNLYRRDLVDGCPCSCRGDWEITDKGLEMIKAKRYASMVDGGGEVNESV